MHVDASMFKAYDIRGIVGREHRRSVRRAPGPCLRQSEARAAGERAVAVGRDGRLSGPALVAALVRGLASTGLDVVDLGAVTTPMLYYVAATRGQHGCRSGIQVTGSHNPKDYNGFKMVLAGRAIYGDDIQDLRQRIEAERYTAGERPFGATMDIGAEYRARIVGDVRQKRRDEDRRRFVATASPGPRRRASCARSATRSSSCTARSTATSRTTTPTRASPRT